MGGGPGATDQEN
jgi:trehalose utilization protein